MKGDGALATTKLVVHQQRGCAPGPLLMCVMWDAKSPRKRAAAMRWCTGAVSYAREFDFLYKKREAARRARGPLAQCEAMKRVPRHTHSRVFFFLSFFIRCAQLRWYILIDTQGNSMEVPIYSIYIYFIVCSLVSISVCSLGQQQPTKGTPGGQDISFRGGGL